MNKTRAKATKKATKKQTTVDVFNFKTSKWNKEYSAKTPFAIQFPQIITPTQAAILLRANSNRPQNIGSINKMTRDVQSDSFEISNDMLCFDKDRNILNGQHRLRSCIEANKPIEIFVGYGYTKKQQKIMDSGNNRSLHDRCVLSGIAVSREGAAIARFVRCQTILGGIPRRATDDEQVQFVVNHLDSLNAVSNILNCNALKKSERTGFRFGNDMGAAFFRAWVTNKDNQENLDLIAEFAEALLHESKFAEMSYQYSVLGGEIIQRNRGLLVREYRKFIDSCKTKMWRAGADQGGRDIKYKKTERYLMYYLNPPKTLMKIPKFGKFDEKSELYLLPEETA